MMERLQVAAIFPAWEGQADEGVMGTNERKKARPLGDTRRNGEEVTEHSNHLPFFLLFSAVLETGLASRAVVLNYFFIP